MYITFKVILKKEKMISNGSLGNSNFQKLHLLEERKYHQQYT